MPPMTTVFRRRLDTSTRLSDKGRLPTPIRRDSGGDDSPNPQGSAHLPPWSCPALLHGSTLDSRILAVRGILPACSNGKRAG